MGLDGQVWLFGTHEDEVCVVRGECCLLAEVSDKADSICDCDVPGSPFRRGGGALGAAAPDRDAAAREAAVAFLGSLRATFEDSAPILTACFETAEVL